MLIDPNKNIIRMGGKQSDLGLLEDEANKLLDSFYVYWYDKEGREVKNMHFYDYEPAQKKFMVI